MSMLYRAQCNEALLAYVSHASTNFSCFISYPSVFAHFDKIDRAVMLRLCKLAHWEECKTGETGEEWQEYGCMLASHELEDETLPFREAMRRPDTCEGLSHWREV